MKKMIYRLALLFVGALTLASCGDFGDINDDPNNPTEQNTKFLFSYALRYIHYPVFYQSFNPQFLLYPQYIAERQNVQYGRLEDTDYATTNFYRYVLKNLKLIKDLNESDDTKSQSYVTAFGSNANQIGAAETLTGYFYMFLTDGLGMIPYSEALKGDEGNFTPKLDAQKDIYTDLHKRLKAAYDMMDESGSLDGSADYAYGGDISKWKKLNASLRMMMAIKLADVDPTDGKAWFAEAFNDGGIEDPGDDFNAPFYADANNENPLYKNVVTEGRRDFCPSKFIVDLMNSLSDPRRPAYFTTNGAGEYKGIPQGIAQGEVANYNKDNSDFNPNMYLQDADFILISAARTLLVEAEAAVRGWISADAANLYERGIRASIEAKFSTFGSSDGTTPTEDAISAYLESDGVKFQGSTDNKIKLIALQRYINGYFEDGMEAWSDLRRLNYPVVKPGPQAVITHIPYRLTYGSADVSANQDQYDAAIATQGENSPETRVWWDVADN